MKTYIEQQLENMDTDMLTIDHMEHDNELLVPIGGPIHPDLTKEMDKERGLDDHDLELEMDNLSFIEQQEAAHKEDSLTKPSPLNSQEKPHQKPPKPKPQLGDSKRDKNNNNVTTLKDAEETLERANKKYSGIMTNILTARIPKRHHNNHKTWDQT